jgi:hypothetical protein
MKPGDPVRVEGRLAHVEVLLVSVRFEDGERGTYSMEHVVPAEAAAPEGEP